MNRFVRFLRRQLDIDLELLRQARHDEETGKATAQPNAGVLTAIRGFRECELKTRLLTIHQHCGAGSGPCDTLEDTYPREDERGCPTKAFLGLPYTDRPGYQPRWRP
ncbi:hypothetical protein GCM10009854_32790 [Saccharopolyspora halophila]|uniref:Uncharacterized protein n=1 Tax=Saccharopolyspora halophila TaxID=405551 RepID=A0ABN3GIK2_9PSEU